MRSLNEALVIVYKPLKTLEPGSIFWRRPVPYRSGTLWYSQPFLSMMWFKYVVFCRKNSYLFSIIFTTKSCVLLSMVFVPVLVSAA